MKLTMACAVLVGFASSAWATEASYRCTDGTVVEAFFSAAGQPGEVRLAFAGQSPDIRLPQVLSADGGRYAEGDLEFWIKGKTARLTRAGAATDCKTP
jgi:membrane-bound inhibitor of C-type lysozyme